MGPLLLILIVHVFTSLLLAFKAKGTELGFNKALILCLLLTAIVGIFLVMRSPVKYPKRVRPAGKKAKI